MTPDPDVLYWSEMAEARAIGELFGAAAARPDDETGAMTASPGGGVAIALRIVDLGFFNRVVGIGVARPAVESDVDEAARFFDEAERSVSVAQIPDHAVPRDVVAWFEARGYARSRRWVKMFHRLADLPEASTDLRIERIGAELADDFARIGIVEAYDFPESIAGIASAAVGRAGWWHYMGFDGETPVSTSSMRIEDGVAWLGFGATSPSHRGRGGQSAMFARRLRDARDAGCRLAVVETGEDTPDSPNPSYRNMVRAGFELAYFRSNWVRSA